MSRASRPASLVVERALRFLRDRTDPVGSIELARAVLSTQTADEAAAQRVLEAAFAGDPRIVADGGGWRVAEAATAPYHVDVEERALVLLQGARPRRGRPYVLGSVSALRLRADEVVSACGGDVGPDASSAHLRQAVREIVARVQVVVHDPPGALAALESWLGEPLPAPLSLRRLAQARLGLPANHDLATLAGRLGVHWRETDDPLDAADAVESCLRALRRGGESLEALRAEAGRGVPPIDWSRFEFGPEFLRRVPRVPGTYRFFDDAGRLLYVGKAKDLNRRVTSYFTDVPRRSARVQRLLDRLCRIEYDAAGSELEAILREAEQIRRDSPERNVQRRHHPAGRRARLRSILILEPAEPPLVLRAFLVHESRLIARIGIGARGGGLKRIERMLDEHFFFAPQGPTPVTGGDVDVELIVRWLAKNRDRAVAFDPTDLRSAAEVVERLRWFLAQGTPFDGDGAPIVGR